MRIGTTRGGAALLASCLFLLAGCSGSSTLEIRPRASLSDSTGLAGLVLVINGRQIRASHFQLDGSGRTGVLLDVPDQGRLQIQVELTQGGQVVAEGIIAWALAEDFEWGLDIFRQASDPTASCFGCSGSDRIPISAVAQGEPDEALWFAWGGKPKGSDIVF